VSKVQSNERKDDKTNWSDGLSMRRIPTDVGITKDRLNYRNHDGIGQDKIKLMEVHCIQLIAY
jgi:hypothetical protein